MNKIEIQNNKFICPMLEKEITERGKINYGVCRKCKYNNLGQIIDNIVYCRFNGSNSQGSTNDDLDSLWEIYNE